MKNAQAISHFRLVEIIVGENPKSLLVHSNGPVNFNSSETIYRMIRNMFEIERNISDSNWHIEQNFMIKRRQKPQNLLKLDVSFLVLSITCLVGTFLFYIMRLMEEHEEKVSQMFNQKRVFDKGSGFAMGRIATSVYFPKIRGQNHQKPKSFNISK